MTVYTWNTLVATSHSRIQVDLRLCATSLMGLFPSLSPSFIFLKARLAQDSFHNTRTARTIWPRQDKFSFKASPDSRILHAEVKMGYLSKWVLRHQYRALLIFAPFHTMPNSCMGPAKTDFRMFTTLGVATRVDHATRTLFM